MQTIDTRKFRKNLEKLPNNDQLAILNAIETIEEATTFADIPNLKAMQGYKNYYRLRVGNWRIGLFWTGAAFRLEDIIGFTFVQSKPPLPQPKEGMAILLISPFLSSSTKACKPLSMYEYAERCFQSRFVGKLTIIVSRSRFDSLTINSLPMSKVPSLQALMYNLLFCGNCSLNCNAIPLPITPTVLTVFTKAAVWASNKLPVR